MVLVSLGSFSVLRKKSPETAEVYGFRCALRAEGFGFRVGLSIPFVPALPLPDFSFMGRRGTSLGRREAHEAPCRDSRSAPSLR